MTTDAYLRRVAEVAASRGYSHEASPARLLDQWAGVVDWAGSTADFEYDDLDYSLIVRDVIEAVLTDPETARYPEFREWQDRVLEVDKRFRQLLLADIRLPGSFHWWRLAVLRCSGAKYRDDLEQMFGIAVPPC